ncbi:protein kinase [Streptomyces sp. NPDC021093]|uniref:serine/threonine-protein kinase n=1 Tax=Streptomyces sp. NPDC021093 TaxID=3365112 RepID=UPI0037B75334
MAELDTSGLVLAWGLVGVAVPALVVRLASLKQLVRLQREVRAQEPEIRAGRVKLSAPPASVARDLLLGFVCAFGLMVWTSSESVPGFALLSSGIYLPDVDELQSAFALAFVPARIAFFSVAGPVLFLWLLLWFLTQRNVRVVGVPSPDGPVRGLRAVGPRLAASLALRLLVGLIAPFGLVVAALVCQIVAALVSRRVLGIPVQAPVPGPAGAFGPAPSVAPGAADPYASTASANATPARPPVPNPYASTASAQAEPPVSAPALGRPAPYVPTQPVNSAPASSVPYQELHPNEPRTIAGYHLIGRIGSGGMGTVYLARREGSATQVALKTIHPELLDHAELLKRFERESEVLAMVPGAYTARVLDAGVDSGRPYLAMELLDGRPLDVHLREQGPIGSAQALRALALALGTALSGVHRLGLVHRDLKPANIMLTSAGPRLLDFGIAALVDGTRLTRTGGGPGTLTYMAPEQFGDEPVGTAADVWAWACCVVCAAHGASPFHATSTGAVIRRIVDTGPEPASLAAVQALDPGLAAVVARALTADPAGRPADGAALVELLAAGGGDVRDQITRGWQTLAGPGWHGGAGA